MTSRTVLSIAMGSAIAVAGLVGGTMVMATNDGGSASNETRSVALDQAQGDAFLTALAGRLGKSVDELKAAIKDTNLEFLDKALADGKISQEQHDKIRSAIESGKIEGFGIGRMGGMGDHGKGMPNGMPFDKGPGPLGGGEIFGQLMGAGDNVAKAVGLADAAALKSELKSGKSLAEIAAANGKSDGLKDALTAEARAFLAAAVSNGKLKQEQADALFAQFESHLDQMINMKMGGMPGSHMKPGGPRPFNNRAPDGGTRFGPITNSQ